MRCAVAALVLATGVEGLEVAAETAAEGREARAAEIAARRIADTWPSAGGSKAARFIERLGQRLGKATGASPFPWRFSVIRDRSLKAFSIGGGRIYVSDGSVLSCADEGELAAVLAHEMGHQLARHFEPAPPRPEDELLAWLGFAVSPPTTGVAIGAVRHVFDAEREDEADRISLRILAAAGYDARAAVTLAERRMTQAADEAGRRAAIRRAAMLRSLAHESKAGGVTDSREFHDLKAELGAERPAE